MQLGRKELQESLLEHSDPRAAAVDYNHPRISPRAENKNDHRYTFFKDYALKRSERQNEPEELRRVTGAMATDSCSLSGHENSSSLKRWGPKDR